MNMSQIFRAIALLALSLGVVGVAVAASAVPVVELAAGPNALRLKLVWVCAAIGALAYGVTIYGLAATQPAADPHARATSRLAELLWAVIPAVVLIALAAPAVERLASRAASPQPALVVTSSATLR